MRGADELQGRLARLLDEDVADLVRLPGGASRETWSFTASGRRLIVRRDPPGAPASSDRATEVEVLRRAAAGGVPVPKIIRTFAADELGSAGFVMEFVDGETIPRRILRDDLYADVRPKMAAQCGEILARIHRIPTDGITGLEAPDGNPALDVLERYREAHDSFDEPHPAFELALRWLRQRAPAPGRTTLVHGDFRHGNLIVGPDGVRSVLDWELVHLGDPWEDLAWLMVRSWRFGGRGEVGGFGDRDDLYRAYERGSGVAVDHDAVRWWEAMNTVKWGVMTQLQAHTHLWGHVRSVELAAIGRRTVECEYDVLNLIADAG